MWSSFTIGLVFGIGFAGWVYSKTMHSTGNNTTTALVVAGFSGFIAMLLLITFINLFT